MLYLFGKVIDLENSKLHYQSDFSIDDLSDCEIASGEWRVNDGWLEGKMEKSAGGLIYTNQSFNFDIVMDFEGRTVPPSCNDLNFSWNTEGWNYEGDDAGIGYIAGIGGWYDNKTGIEHYPECKVHSLTQAFQLESGRLYHIQAGSIGNHCFMFVDGKPVIEMFDPAPIDPQKYGRVGLGVYSSHVQFRNLKVYQANWQSREQSY